jgi:hypothetical protein
MKVDEFFSKVVNSMVKKNPGLNREQALTDIKTIFSNDSTWSKVLHQMEELSNLCDVKESEVV